MQEVGPMHNASALTSETITSIGSTVLATSVVVLAVTSIALPLTVKVLRKKNVMDVPNQRSLHSDLTLRGGGIALSFGFAAGSIVSGPLLWPLWLSTLGFAILGAWDDFKSRSAMWRLSLQILVAVSSALGLMLLLGESIVLFALGAVLLVFTVNAVNFMDGINGITSLHSIIWGIAYALLFWLVNLSEYVAFATVLTFIGLAFLPWNFPRARLFLGDSGSYLIGGAVGTFALLGILAGTPIAALAPLAIYTADTGTAMVRRFRAGESLTEAHKSHVFQQLVAIGWSHQRAATTTASFTTVAAALGILSIGKGTLIQVIALLLILLVCAIYLQLPRRTKFCRAHNRKETK